jgi:hypothetical protein
MHGPQTPPNTLIARQWFLGLFPASSYRRDTGPSAFSRGQDPRRTLLLSHGPQRKHAGSHRLASAYSQTAETSSTNASWPGSSRPTLFTANMRARPVLHGRSRNANSVARAAATAAVLNSPSLSLPVTAFATASRGSSTVLSPRAALPRAIMACVAPLSSGPTSRHGISTLPLVAFPKCRRATTINVPRVEPVAPAPVMPSRWNVSPISGEGASDVAANLSSRRRNISPVSPSPSAASAWVIVVSISRMRRAARCTAAATCLAVRAMSQIFQNGHSAGAANNVSSSASRTNREIDRPDISIEVTKLPTSGLDISRPATLSFCLTRR